MTPLGRPVVPEGGKVPWDLGVEGVPLRFLGSAMKSSSVSCPMSHAVGLSVALLGLNLMTIGSGLPMQEFRSDC